MIKNKKKIKNKGFTLAEILVTLTIIGIIAAILFPSILANYTERTLNAKRQALFARMSQAMGELGDSFANYEDKENPAQNSALKFINEGLSKAYKIAAACDYATLKSCDIPETVTKLDGSTFDLIKNSEDIFKYSPVVSSTKYDGSLYGWVYNTEPAGFITKNGESILLFFNPRCKAKGVGSYISTNTNYTTTACVNMIYDLNGGKQKPNRMNEDIGFMTVFYSDTPYVVAPKITTNTAYTATANTDATNAAYGQMLATYSDAKAACAAMGENIKIPSYEDLGSVGINMALYSDMSTLDSMSKTTYYYWTSTVYPYDAKYNYVVEIDNRTAEPPDVSRVDTTSTGAYRYLCVQD